MRFILLKELHLNDFISINVKCFASKLIIKYIFIDGERPCTVYIRQVAPSLGMCR